MNRPDTPGSRSHWTTEDGASSTQGQSHDAEGNKHVYTARSASKDIREHMNIQHFEALQKMFLEHVNEDGSSGFYLDMFLKVFGKVLGGNLSEDQLITLFNKIDANSDGSVSWDEFSTYMMTVSLEEATSTAVLDEKIKALASTPHRDMIIFIDLIPRERKYVTVSREGYICLWTVTLKLQRVVNIREFIPKSSWVSDAKYLHDHNRVALITDDRRLCFFDVTSIKPRLLATISQLEYNPLTLAYFGHYDDDVDLLIIGDDGGYVSIIKMRQKFLVDCAASESEKNDSYLTPHHLSKRDSLERYNITMYTRKCHHDWVTQVQYFEEMNSYVSCSADSQGALTIGDLGRRTCRKINVPGGVKCFNFCRRPSFLVTGGRDKIVRLWNPYVLSKPAGSLDGHTAAITQIVINHEESHIISLAEDKVIKVWSARSLTCLQTVVDTIPHRPENIISSIFYDSSYRKLITGSDKLETWPLFQNSKKTVPKSHESPVVTAMFNTSFHQVVSAAQDGTVTVWDPLSGIRTFQFQQTHGNLELTSACFDKSCRRLITGSRDGIVKMWNYNNGQLLKKMLKSNVEEVGDVIYLEMGSSKNIICVGWDRLVSMFQDNPEFPEAEPTRVYNGAGNSVHRGHEGDITTVDFAEPNWLVTGSVDGAIVVWNLEAGIIRFTLREPFLSLKRQEEKPVEKVLFYKDRKTKKLALLTCHADGVLRFWDLLNAKLLNENNVQVAPEEGLTSMCLHSNGNDLLVAGSLGHLRFIDLPTAEADTKDTNSCISKSWRAHVTTVSSITFIEEYNCIMSASRDCSVRLWTVKGDFIGIFGQETEWNRFDPSTYLPLPADVEDENRLESQRNQFIMNRRENLKKKVLETWKTVPKEAHMPGQDAQGFDFKENIKRLKVKATQKHCIAIWKDFWKKRKDAENWKISDELITIERESKFFSFNGQVHRPRTSPNVSTGSMKAKYESIFHMVTCYDLEDISEMSLQRNGGSRKRKEVLLTFKK